MKALKIAIAVIAILVFLNSVYPAMLDISIWPATRQRQLTEIAFRTASILLVAATAFFVVHLIERN